MRPLAGALLALAFGISAAHAHTQSTSRLFLALGDTSADSLVIDLAIVDLLQVVDLDRDGNGSLTWGEITHSQASLLELVTGGVGISAGDLSCRLIAADPALSLAQYEDLPHLRVSLGVDCATARAASAGDPVFRYGLLFDINPSHRALLHVTGASGGGAWILSPESTEIRLSGEVRPTAVFVGFAAEGIRHILSGYDHLVFLLLLILPAAGRGSTRARILATATIVTAFTLAHSITLVAATMEVVRLPAKPVEIGIAVSIVIAAVVNLCRPAYPLGWKIAFAFGLLHGFGFAGALAEMNLERGTLLVSLLSFNVGVEAGQLLIVAAAVPLLELLAVWSRYRSFVVPSASLACAVLGAIWTTARL